MTKPVSARVRGPSRTEADAHAVPPAQPETATVERAPAPPPSLPATIPASELLRPGKWSAWATLALSLFLTAFTFVINRSAQEHEAALEFDVHVADIERRIDRRLRTYEQTLRGAAGLFAANEHLDREQWRRYVAALALEQSFPGVQGIGFAQSIAPRDLTDHERAVRREGFPDYRVFPGQPRDAYSSIVLLEPFSGANLRAFGFDMYAEPVRRAAMARARDTGLPTLSGKVTLVQEPAVDSKERQAGFLMYLPIYAHEAPSATPEQRRAALLGWVYAPFRAGDFVNAIFGDDERDVLLRLYDGDEPNPAALLHQLPSRAGQSAATPRYERLVRMPVLGRTWTLEVRSLPAFDARTSARAPLLLVGGLLVSVLLFAIVWVLATARERALALAASMTETLRGMNDTLEEKVTERTTDLERSNARLQEQIAARERAQRDRAAALERLQKQVDHLRQLAASALLVNRSVTLSDKLAVVAEQACTLLDARHAFVQIRLDDGTEVAADAGDGDESARKAWREAAPRRYAETQRVRTHAGDFIALPLVRRSGAELGFLALAGKRGKSGAFGVDDEVILSQLALLAAGSIETGAALDEEQRARAEAEAANRAKDDFIAVVSHELRTPLNAIQGWLHILRRRGAEDGVRERALAVMQRNLNAQVQLIEDLLDAARLTGGQLHLASEPVDLAALLARAIESWRPAADEKGIGVAVAVRDPEAHVTGDARRLEQVIWNLLSNAVKFTPAGGTIDVVLERAGNRLRLAVTDTGAGVPTEFLPFVFDRFRQADASSKRRFGGLGLGLALVKGLVEAHGGRVEVSSPGVGEGASFMIELPVRAVRGSDGSTSPTTRERGARLEGMRILVVDDHPDALDLVETILTDEGASVITAATGARAMEQLHAKPGRPDALVCDIGLPDEDGYQVVARIRDRERALGWTPRLPVIALTAFTRPQERARALAAGFDAQMSKPVDPDALVSELVRLATRGRSDGMAGA